MPPRWWWGSSPVPRRARWSVENDRVLYTTPKLRAEVGLEPFTLRITTLGGREVCAIGGPEKNHFQTWDSYNTGICRSAVDGAPIAVECFALRPQEAIYGMGEQFIKLNKVGQTIDLNMLESLGTTTPRSYKNVPFFLSTSGYGVYLNHSSRITCWVGSLCAPDIQVAVEDDFLDYYVIVGDLKQILSQYTDITGKGHVPPLWSFGFWQSKISYRAADEALEVVRKHARGRGAGGRPPPRHPLVQEGLVLRPGVRSRALSRPGGIHRGAGPDGGEALPLAASLHPGGLASSSTTSPPSAAS